MSCVQIAKGLDDELRGIDESEKWRVEAFIRTLQENPILTVEAQVRCR